jgi:hypothetical protein
LTEAASEELSTRVADWLANAADLREPAMRHYVYALIDPTQGNAPFYIGKGMDNRLQSHFKAAGMQGARNDSEVVGCDTQSIVEDAAAERTVERLTRIVDLRNRGFDHTHIARIVARRMDEQTAFAVEAFLIRSVFGVGRLTNCVEGAHAERFRCRNDEGFINGFDMDIVITDAQIREIEAQFGRHYVYSLRDPESGRAFYVGKGTGRRMFAHFADAANVNEAMGMDGHLPVLSKMVRDGHGPRDICRVEARVEHEQQAFALEALLIKFVYGLTSIDNRVAGHHGEMFRAKGDWEPRRGFDLPYVCDPGKQVDRTDMRDGMIGEGLAVPLLAVAANFPDLAFDPPRVLDSKDLSIEADLLPEFGGAGARVKVFIRRRKLQVELRSRRKAQKEWVKSHFTRLGAYPLRRKDDVFFPDAWRGSGNMTDDLEEIAHRIRIMQEIVNATDAASLSHEARSLLPNGINVPPE